jgi:hypothetical protein
MNDALSVTPFRNARMTLRFAMRIALLLFNLSVIWPASIIGIGLAADYLAGQDPFKVIVESVYQYADASIRPASAGYVLVTECLDPVPTPDNLLEKPRKLVVVCQNPITKELPVEEVIASQSAALLRIYQILVMAGLGVYVLVDFPRILRNTMQMVGWAVEWASAQRTHRH